MGSEFYESEMIFHLCAYILLNINININVTHNIYEELLLKYNELLLCRISRGTGNSSRCRIIRDIEFIQNFFFFKKR